MLCTLMAALVQELPSGAPPRQLQTIVTYIHSGLQDKILFDFAGPMVERSILTKAMRIIGFHPRHLLQEILFPICLIISEMQSPPR